MTRRVNSCGNQPCDMGDIDHKVCTDFLRNVTEDSKVDDAWIRTSASDYQGGVVLKRQLTREVVVY